MSRKRKKEIIMRKKPKNESTDNFGYEGSKGMVLWEK
jgi:hypothetical protein